MIAVHPAAQRFRTAQPGILTRHCFSAGAHYDPANIAFGPLVALDEHTLEPGAGFARHAHRGVEIVSWVLAGVLRHEDCDGRVELIEAGTALHQSAGSGIEHSEGNASATEPLRFVQMWLLAQPGAPALGVTAPPLRTPAGTLRVLHVRRRGVIAAAAFAHLYVLDGTLSLGGQVLARGDSVRAREQALALGGTGDVLAWSLHSPAGP